MFTVQNPNLTKIWSVYTTSHFTMHFEFLFPLMYKQSYSIRKLDRDSVTFVRDSTGGALVSEPESCTGNPIRGFTRTRTRTRGSGRGYR